MNKFTITNKELKSPLSIASQFAPVSSPMPILTNIIFGNGYILAGDGDAQIKIDAPVSGNFAAPADKLKKITSTFSSDAELSFDVKDKLFVKSGKSKLSVPILPSDHFPSPKTEGDCISIVLKQEDIKSHIQNVIHAMGVNNVRVWMNSVLFKDGDVSATNGGELAFSSQETDQKFEFAIPAKYAKHVLNLMSVGYVNIDVYENKIIFNLSGIEFTCPRLSEKCPDMTKAIPNIQNEIVHFLKADFMAASAKAAISANKFMSALVTVKENEMTIKCMDFDGESTDVLDVQYDGGPFQFGYNIEQMRAAVNAIDSEVINLHIGGHVTGTAMFMPENGNQKCVITPMRI